jgi:hypothetical protein
MIVSPIESPDRDIVCPGIQPALEPLAERVQPDRFRKLIDHISGSGAEEGNWRKLGGNWGRVHILHWWYSKLIDASGWVEMVSPSNQP